MGKGERLKGREGRKRMRGLGEKESGESKERERGWGEKESGERDVGREREKVGRERWGKSEERERVGRE